MLRVVQRDAQEWYKYAGRVAGPAAPLAQLMKTRRSSETSHEKPVRGQVTRPPCAAAISCSAFWLYTYLRAGAWCREWLPPVHGVRRLHPFHAGTAAGVGALQLHVRALLHAHPRPAPPRRPAPAHPFGSAAGGLCSFSRLWLSAQMSLEWTCLANGSPSASARKAGRCSGSSRQQPGSRDSGVLSADSPACRQAGQRRGGGGEGRAAWCQESRQAGQRRHEGRGIAGEGRLPSGGSAPQRATPCSHFQPWLLAGPLPSSPASQWCRRPRARVCPCLPGGGWTAGRWGAAS